MKKTLLSLAFLASLTLVSPVSAQTTEASLRAQIEAILAQIKQIQAQLDAAQNRVPGSSNSGNYSVPNIPGSSNSSNTSSTVSMPPISSNSSSAGTPAFCYKFNSNLTIGSRGEDVKALSHMLVVEGISNRESDVFDEDTAAYVVKLQDKYGIRKTGYFGPLTRAKINSLNGVCPPTSSNSNYSSTVTLPNNYSSTVALPVVISDVSIYADGVKLSSPITLTEGKKYTITWSAYNLESNKHFMLTMQGVNRVDVYGVLSRNLLDSNTRSFDWTPSGIVKDVELNIGVASGNAKAYSPSFKVVSSPAPASNSSSNTNSSATVSIPSVNPSASYSSLPTVYFSASNGTKTVTSTGSTVGETLVVNVGDYMNYSWNTNGYQGSSSFAVSGQGGNCWWFPVNTGTDSWVIKTPNGTYPTSGSQFEKDSAKVTECQAGHTFDITFKGSNDAGSNSAKIRVYVNPVTASNSSATVTTSSSTY